MSDYEEKALRDYLEYEGEWTPDFDPDSVPNFSVDVARVIVRKWGGWKRLDAGLEALMQARSSILEAQNTFGDLLPVSDVEEALERVDVLLTLADQERESATIAEEVLRDAGYQSSGHEVTDLPEGKGRPRNVHSRHAEGVFLSATEPGAWRNTIAIRAAMRPKLEALGWLPEKLEEPALRETVKQVIKDLRKREQSTG